MPPSQTPEDQSPFRRCSNHGHGRCARYADPGYRTCGNCRRYQAAFQERKRQARLSAGLCYRCGCSQPPIDGRLCAQHKQDGIDRSRNRRLKLLAQGCCIDCNKTVNEPGYQRCWSCRLKHKDSKKKGKTTAATGQRHSSPTS